MFLKIGHDVTLQPLKAIKITGIEYFVSLNNLLYKSALSFQISLKSSSALYHSIPERKRLTEYSPVNELKAVKNKVEIAGMKQAHVRLSLNFDNLLLPLLDAF